MMDQRCSMGRLLLVAVVVVVFAVVATSQQQSQGQNSRSRGGGGGGNHGASCSRNSTFDYFVLAIQWPSSFCLEKENACNLAAARSRKWLVHGLWPNRLNNNNNRRRNRRAGGNNSTRTAAAFEDIAFCCGPSYNGSALDAGLVRQLSEKWPTLQANGRNQAFWAHEFNKHGTCARGVSQLRSQQQYFSTALQLYGRFDLNRAPLRSNTSYSLAELHRALDPLVEGKKVRMECSLSGGRNAKNATSIFSEAHICLDKSLQAINCHRGDDHQCRGKILFP